jgi:hypothetical protein
MLTLAAALGAMAILVGCPSFPRTVESSENSAPLWTREIPKNNDLVYYVGSTTDAKRQEDGQTDAFMQALQTATTAVNAQVLVLYERTRSETGNDDSRYGRVIKNGLEVRAAATIKGARTEKLYWEKIADKDKAEKVFYRYNVWALVSVPKEDFRKSLIEELKKLSTEITPGDQDALNFMNKLEDAFKDTTFPQ